MDSYDPFRAPEPAEWLTLDESERIELVERYHLESGSEVGDAPASVHAAIHVAVENQIAMGEEGVPEALARLMRQGLTRHEAVHAIGSVLAEEMFEIVQRKVEHDPERYRRRVGKLSAKRWRKGKW